mmetsp:Transcript_929/g.3427  ORF Transcript_929/g.3427 Transcript_929/m.3427 type:complete len:244 (+) Transcript_929:2954-3685(+)
MMFMTMATTTTILWRHDVARAHQFCAQRVAFAHALCRDTNLQSNPTMTTTTTTTKALMGNFSFYSTGTGTVQVFVLVVNSKYTVVLVVVVFIYRSFHLPTLVQHTGKCYTSLYISLRSGALNGTATVDHAASVSFSKWKFPITSWSMTRETSRPVDDTPATFKQHEYHFSSSSGMCAYGISSKRNHVGIISAVVFVPDFDFDFVNNSANAASSNTATNSCSTTRVSGIHPVNRNRPTSRISRS